MSSQEKLSTLQLFNYMTHLEWVKRLAVYKRYATYLTKFSKLQKFPLIYELMNSGPIFALMLSCSKT